MCHCGHEDDAKANSANVLWQRNMATFARAAEEAKAAWRKAKDDSARKKAGKLERMQARRNEVRANATESSDESMASVA